jgi:tetratricopeptide (TPR) repeat protein
MAAKTELEKLQIQAKELFDKTEYQKVISLLSDEVLNEYDDSKLFALRAWAHDRLEQPEEVFKYVNKAIELDPLYFLAYRVRGNAWQIKKNYEKAIQDYNKAIELNPDDSFAYNNLGNSYLEKNEFERAKALFDKAIELNPDYPDPYNGRVNYYYSTGKYDEAIAECDAVIKLGIGSFFIFYNRGNAYYRKGDFDKAYESYTESIKLNKKNSFAYNNRGIIQKGRHNLEKAAEEFRMAINADSKNYTAYKNLGDVLFEMGQSAEALREYEKLVELAPHDEYYKSLRDKAKARLGEAVITNTNAEKGESTINTATYIEQLLDGISEPEKKKIRMAWVDVDEVIVKIRELLLYKGQEDVVHYTRIKTADLIAMTPKFKLRYSNVVFMNDPEEGDVFLEHLDAPELIKSFKKVDKKDDNNIYLGSFLPESKKDYLNMWRTYGKNEHNEEATGCSFLIKRDFFDPDDSGSLYAEAGKYGPIGQGKPIDKLHSQPLYKVVYYDKGTKRLQDVDGLDLTTLTTQISNFKSKLRLLLSLRDNDDEENREKKNGVIDGLVYRFVSELRYFFKSAEYQFEKELRVIKYYPIEDKMVIADKEATEIPRKLYIESTKNLRPYLTTITLGPKVIHPERYMYIEAQLKKKGHQTIVKKSTCSYQ